MVKKKKECPLGIWKFTDKAIKSMNKLVEKTRKVGIEYGAMIEGELKENKERVGILKLGTECTGFECTVHMIRKPKGIYAGEFHTHPEVKEILPSSSDLKRYETVGHFFCIGAPINSKIKCFNRKFKALDPEWTKQRRAVIESLPKLTSFHSLRRATKRLLERDYDEFSPYDCKL